MSNTLIVALMPIAGLLFIVALGLYWLREAKTSIAAQLPTQSAGKSAEAPSRMAASEVARTISQLTETIDGIKRDISRNTAISSRAAAAGKPGAKAVASKIAAAKAPASKPAAAKAAARKASKPAAAKKPAGR